MRYLPAGIAAFATLSAITTGAQSTQSWSEVRSVPNGTGGTTHYVVIPEARQRDQAYYKAIGEELCPSKTECMVYFWTDPNHVPQDRWMSTADTAVAVASYEESPRYAKPSLHLACRLYADRKAGEQDKCAYFPGSDIPDE